jgi:hypothetical protein
MSNKTHYTAEEWAILLRSPGMAGIVVVASSPSGPVGAIQESFAMGKVVAEVKHKGGPNELITALVNDMVTPDGRKAAQAVDLFGKKAAELRTIGLDLCKRAGEIIVAKSPTEADDYKRWLLSISQHVAEAAKEGGFLGFGGTLVSEDEKAAIAATSQALGLA